MSTALDPLRLPLKGSHLIEASAGTGKTWTIAALYLRLVLGHGDDTTAPPRPLLPAEVLVMTFTRAATRELSDRIRQRLMQAARCFRGEDPVPPDDTLLAGLLEGCEEGLARSRAAWRLAQAADAMDEAAIHTIDAWCQRMLREHAFDSGQLFDETLLPDEQALREQAVRDYWREALYPLDAETLGQALQVWPTVDALDQDVKGLLPRLEAAPAPEGDAALGELVAQAHRQLHDDLAELKAGWTERVGLMRQWLDDQCGRKPSPFNGTRLRASYYTPWLDQLLAWAQDDTASRLELPDAAKWRLTPPGMEEALSGKSQVDAWPTHFECFEALLAALDRLPDPATPMRWHAARWVQARLHELKRQSGVYGFADMLQRLVDALQGPHGERLRQRILVQYPAALIDEFQDTSPLQYRLFDLLYRVADNDPARALFLIGDPKQSIYRFRGADIYSYLQARQATQGRHAVLGTNHRSTQALVAAVNRVFEHAETGTARGAFAFRQPDGTSLLPFEAVAARGRADVLHDCDGVVPALRLVVDAEPSSKEAAHSRMAGHAAEFIVRLLSDARAGLDVAGDGGGRPRALRPADIAVLVRSGKEAEVVRRALGRRGVASVYLSDKDSVFDSPEARDLLAWLRAAASPRDLRLARSAHASSTMGLDLAELLAQSHDDGLWDERLADLRRLQLTWQRQGVLAMLRQTIHLLGLAARWLALPQGERRITNVLHLAELLQAASTQAQGEQGLIRWLAQRVGDHGEGDERIVRLESDADLVQVVTVHKSKGLEYPVVVMPFAGSVRPVDSRSGLFDLVDGDGQRRIALTATAQDIEAADLERLREDLRLMYVALTRPRHALWLGVSAVRQGNSKSLVLPRSALGHLLGATAQLSAEDLVPLLSQWLTADGSVVLAPLAGDAPLTRMRAVQADAPLPPAPVYDAAFERDWAIGSFSSMVRDMPAGAHGAAWLPVSARLEAVLSAEDRPDVPAPSTTAFPEQPWHRFPRGALPGNFLHEQMEWLAGEGFALEASSSLSQALRRRCERQGWGHLADDVLQWLGKVVTTPLPLGGTSVVLQDLRATVPEMEFWLPSDNLSAARVDALCQAGLWPGLERPPLPERHLKGMLMGFADLVFEHEGRYWVMDYKSTTLGAQDKDYDASALSDAMLRHRYDVQGALYLLALHRLLSSRLGAAYDPAHQLGGAVFLFMRGIDGPERGCCLLPASPEGLPQLLSLIEGLEHALQGIDGANGGGVR